MNSFIMKNILIGAFATLIIFSACSPEVPVEEEIRSQIMGRYCGENSTLEISDSTYRNTLFQKGVMSGNTFAEYCKGKYTLEFVDKQWIMKFGENDSPSRTTIYDCAKEVVVWNSNEKYVIMNENEEILMKSLKGDPLTKGACN